MRKIGLLAVVLTLVALTSTAVSTGQVRAGDSQTCNGKWATISAGAAHGSGYVFTGTSKNDVIVGTSGDDLINGNGGNDLICGYGGDDEIHGNSGNDNISGGVGDDVVTGDAGDDTLRGAWAPYGNSSNAFETQGEGSGADDHVYGGSGNDTLIDFWGWNYLDGGSGNDQVHGIGELYGNSNNDTVNSNFWYYLYWAYGSRSNAAAAGICDLADGPQANGCGAPGSYIDGGSGNDTLIGTWRDDTLYGQANNDELWGDGGDDSYNGGSGRDVCEEDGTSCETVVED